MWSGSDEQLALGPLGLSHPLLLEWIHSGSDSQLSKAGFCGDGGSVVWKHRGCLMLTFLWHRAKGRVKIALNFWPLPHINCIPRGWKRSCKLVEEPLVGCGDTFHAELPGLGGWNGVPNSGIQTFGCSQGRKSLSSLGMRIPWPCEGFQDAPGCCVKDGLVQRWDQEMEQGPNDNVHVEGWGCRQQRQCIPCLEHTERMGMPHARGGWGKEYRQDLYIKPLALLQ